METKLARITEVAKRKPKERFTSLAHLISEDALRECHKELGWRKAAGVDRVTKARYEENLDTNIRDLVGRMKRQAYKPQPVRRVYIPKAGTSKKRPLGIPAYEDKMVQACIAKILNAIYEADFLDFSFGFRPGRGSHDALKALGRIIEENRVNYIVDADIKGFFDHVDHEWLMKFLEHRIADPNLLRIIARFLKAGVMEAGAVYATPEGTPQGGVVSPILANIYLHYVLDLWFAKVVRKQCRGKAYMVRYADDFVCCFEYEEDARKYYQMLIERLRKFNLEIAEDKTKIIAFGKNAEGICQRQGKRKPDTFDFLGFTHYCGKSRHGKFRVKRQTNRKKYKASLQRAKEWLKAKRDMPVAELIKQLGAKLLGYYRYYGITDNSPAVNRFYHEVNRLLYKWLNRRSQRKSFSWEKFRLLLTKFPLPRPKVYVNVYDIRPQFLGCKL